MNKLKGKVYSDYHFLPEMKIEVLPGDQMSESLGVLVPSDRLILVARPVKTKYVADQLRSDFTDEFRANATEDHNTIERALGKSLRAFNTSFLTYMGNPELAPESGAMVLIAYIDSKNQVTFAQVGPIILKQRINGRYVTQTANHTFDNPEERRRISKVCASFITPNLPSRLLGHPRWSLIDESHGFTVMSAIPLIKTIRQ